MTMPYDIDLWQLLMIMTIYDGSQHCKETPKTIDSLGLISFLTYEQRKNTDRWKLR